MSRSMFYALREKYPRRPQDDDRVEAALEAFKAIDPSDYSALSEAIDRYRKWVEGKGPGFEAIYRFDNFLRLHWGKWAPPPTPAKQPDAARPAPAASEDVPDLITWGPRAQA